MSFFRKLIEIIAYDPRDAVREKYAKLREMQRKVDRIQVLSAWLRAARQHLRGDAESQRLIEEAEKELRELSDWLLNYEPIR